MRHKTARNLNRLRYSYSLDSCSSCASGHQPGNAFPACDRGNQGDCISTISFMEVPDCLPFEPYVDVVADHLSSKRTARYSGLRARESCRQIRIRRSWVRGNKNSDGRI